MKLNIMAKKIQIGPSFSEYAEKKLNQKLDKFFEDEAEANLSVVMGGLKKITPEYTADEVKEAALDMNEEGFSQ